MASSSARMLSGCVVWIIVFGILGLCMLPTVIMIASMTSESNLAMQILGSILCPAKTNPKLHSYTATPADKNGKSQAKTIYELYCIDENGVILKRDAIVFTSLWLGFIAMIGLIIMALFSFSLTRPTYTLITRLLKQEKS